MLRQGPPSALHEKQDLATFRYSEPLVRAYDDVVLLTAVQCADQLLHEMEREAARIHSQDASEVHVVDVGLHLDPRISEFLGFRTSWVCSPSPTEYRQRNSLQLPPVL